LLALLVLPASAAAHPLDLGTLHIRELPGGDLEERLVATAGWWAVLAGVPKQAVARGELEAWVRPMFEATLASSGPEAGGLPCRIDPLDASVEPPGVALRVRLHCPSEGPLSQRLSFLSALPSGFQLLVAAELSGRRTEQVLEASRSSLVLERAGSGTGPGVGSFLWLGVEHILTGWDHLLFLLCLVLAGGGPRRLLGIATAFTVGHSLTLGLAALDVVRVPATLVEPAIAASIVFVAVQNLRGVGSEKRWLLALGFGLVHGFGFASALAEAQLRTSGVVVALLGFNLGVEVGQAVLVALAAPAIRWARSRPRFVRWGLPGLSLVAAGMGSYWFVSRAVAG